MRTSMGVLGVAGASIAVAAGGQANEDDDGGRDRSPQVMPATLTVTASGRRIATLGLERGSAVDASALRRLLSQRLPAVRRATRGRAYLIYRYDRESTVRRALALGPAGGVVKAVQRPQASRIDVPVVRQAQRNTCESAALEMLLAAAGRQISQGRLQASLPTSGGLDPEGEGPQRVWGDPELGYVGRPDGGGIAGGFGVYPPPVAATARRFGVKAQELSRRSARTIYRRVLSGRAVMAWIGLSAGPYGQWRSPAGRAVKVNFGEHTVVLTGMTRDGRLRVHNPLRGTEELWTRTRFEAAWDLLDRRALGV